MLSKKTKYAIKALQLLARAYDSKTPVRITDISEQEKIPKKFLEAILLELRKNGILGSKMGASGGYYLLKHPKEINLAMLIRLTNGPISLVPCVSLNFFEECTECIAPSICGIKAVMEEVRDANVKILSQITIFDLNNREDGLRNKS